MIAPNVLTPTLDAAPPLTTSHSTTSSDDDVETTAVRQSCRRIRNNISVVTPSGGRGSVLKNNEKPNPTLLILSRLLISENDADLDAQRETRCKQCLWLAATMRK